MRSSASQLQLCHPRGQCPRSVAPQSCTYLAVLYQKQHYALSGGNLRWFIRLRMTLAPGRTSVHPLPAGGGVLYAEFPIAGFLLLSIAVSAYAPFAQGVLGLGLVFAFAVSVTMCLIPALFRRGCSGASSSLRARRALVEDFPSSSSSIAALLVRAPD